MKGSYCKAIAEETEKAAVYGGTRKFFRRSKVSFKGPLKVAWCYLNALEVAFQTKPEVYVGGRSTLENSLIKLRIQTPLFHQLNNTHAK